jgi:lipoprotein-anchoring transpeptidase ErfK/SrfK
MPIIARFAAPVTDRSAVAAELTVHSRPRVIGAWHWFGPQEAVYRPERFWPAHTGVWIEGVTSFHVGASHIAVASAATKEMVVRVNGRVARRIPVSMGKGTSLSTTTTSGVHLVMGKFAQMIFDSASVGCSVGCPGHYRVLVHDAIRITDSGEFVHGAPWDTPVQGHLNVSHGCVDVGPADARWLYAHAQIGDVVEITGTRRHLSPSNGWGFWQIPWRGWLAGTAPLPTRG